MMHEKKHEQLDRISREKAILTTGAWNRGTIYKNTTKLTNKGIPFYGVR